MPQINFIQAGQREPTALERTLSSFAERDMEIQKETRDADQLEKIYKEHLKDGQNIQGAIQAVQTNRSLSPSKKIEEVKRLTEFDKYNQTLQKKAQKDIDNAAAIRQREIDMDLPEGSLAAYKDPRLAIMASRPTKQNQADRPINDDQLKRIQAVEATQAYKDADIAEKERLLRNNGVSKENIEGVTKTLRELAKPEIKRQEVTAAEEAKDDTAFAQELAEADQRIFRTQQTLDKAIELTEQNVTGGLWDQSMQQAGLLQFTSDGFRQYASYAKEMVKNQNIRNIVGSQISQMEFQFFRDATISERFSQEANRAILRKEQAAIRYEKLYTDIGKDLIAKNGGKTPQRFREKVNAEFAKQSPKIAQEIKDAAADFEAIQNTPKGYVLMYDDKRRPLHVKENEVQRAIEAGASLR